MFTPKQAVKAAGMDKQKPTFDRWMQANIARPTVPSEGRGFPAQWSGPALVALLLTKRLGKVGIDLRLAANIAELATKDARLFSLIGWEVAIDLNTLEFKADAKGLRVMDNWRQGRGMVLFLDMDEISETIARRLGIDTMDLIGD